MVDKRLLERVSFVHRGKVFTCVAVEGPPVAGTPDLSAAGESGVWSVTVGGVKRDAFRRSRDDTQQRVVARVITWYEHGMDGAAEP